MYSKYLDPKKLPNILQFLPKWQISPNLVTLVYKQKGIYLQGLIYLLSFLNTIASKGLIKWKSLSLLLKWAIPGLFFVYLFDQRLQFLQQISEKCPSSILCQDSNPWPSGHESRPITTGPGLPPNLFLQFVLKHLITSIM